MSVVIHPWLIGLLSNTINLSMYKNLSKGYTDQVAVKTVGPSMTDNLLYELYLVIFHGNVAEIVFGKLSR